MSVSKTPTPYVKEIVNVFGLTSPVSPTFPGPQFLCPDHFPKGSLRTLLSVGSNGMTPTSPISPAVAESWSFLELLRPMLKLSGTFGRPRNTIRGWLQAAGRQLES